jgi:hypothetical protein
MAAGLFCFARGRVFLRFVPDAIRLVGLSITLCLKQTKGQEQNTCFSG